MNHQDFLVEIGAEELPPKALRQLAEAFAQGIRQRLEKAQLSFSELTWYAAPRRLAVHVSGLAEKQPDLEVEKRGPALQAAFDAAGAPTKACEGFARSCGTTPDKLEKLETDKGVWLVFRSKQAGAPTTGLLPAIVEESLAALPIPKRMRWGARRTEFVRPVHWIIMLFGEKVIDCEILGLKAGNTTLGHRFHHPAPIEIATPANYKDALKNTGYVMADFEERKALIRQQVEAIAKQTSGMAVIDEELLEEVASLNEWPTALMGRFEDRFLEVPAEALISTMKGNQKYFHVVDAEGRMLPYFITVANIESKDPQQVIDGNERVIRPRLSDAAFFFSTDKKRTLASRLEDLKPIVFQQQLGTVYDKAIRVGKLAAKIAAKIDSNPEWAQRAGELSKTDLATEMVMEFPELQGTMGRYYAAIDSEPEEVSMAQEEQYLPRFAGDQLPTTLTGCAVSLADKLDTIVGIFGINQPPTGAKDPFGLRRAALGVLRILVEKKLDLDLAECVQWAQELHGDLPAENLETAVVDYMLDRFRAWYEEAGVPTEVFLSVLARRPTKPVEFDQRVLAVAEFLKLDAAQALAAANKRVSNILSKEQVDISAESANPELFTEEAEKNLFRALQEKSESARPYIEQRNFTQALQQLAELKDVIDLFFDKVMVMVDDPAIRSNRMTLLASLRHVFLQVADISLLQNKA
ncbi:Glycyl-tRNA synthetase, beta subunit [Hahella chejuensis KCTC 2396]|uniref:Glycine--tRNA ligase beta subunit n=1 Tax=Hahella chejuensis (strain KCTC 2396) TaxID=349521 RepID=SYGB_HAHCH|nr:glycine--tRNA ligase subunit beta [Hahella chejuensis]Q2SQY0.1 RecName: Full=Glycine--tRNA ligase beta subunit; AltName: Full=Glycyl-tRNA synthetase beta subunit; Short=GlyRS [Hahella chejuensis KCTC 2396]ABC26944.1 Glycyl-tRNA synthetase, beta subunit [Hahella chejuensis KCTC 2396]